MPSTRIALIRARYNPFGGAEKFVANAMTSLQTFGIKLTIVTRTWQKQTDTHALIVNPFYIGNVWRDWSFSRAVCKAVQQKPFDLVQSHERIPCCDIYRAGDGVHREWLKQRAQSQNIAKRFSTMLNPYHFYTCYAEKKTISK